MSKDWTPTEIEAVSKTMKAVGNMSYEDVEREVNASLRILDFGKAQCSGSYPCPRCGQKRMSVNPIRDALSRYAQVQICNQCGIEEALFDYYKTALPLSKWAITITPELFRCESGSKSST